ncbi:metalloregulator ArsR/SmtB family transcription factor [Bosea sp. 124]|uniref:ArsR/SmtB family transcription factor n=1 Tax=Bosea sp. 124 TaxID=2135642 RepID=UPI0020BDB43C|nr:metalloregulator ArsR/SmtB family transcription factor [Bosea sp. 124]
MAFPAAADIEARTLPDPDLACVEADRMARAGDASELFKILAHRTRLLVLCQIAERERSVSELERVLGLRQAAISPQLARLRIQGIVSTRRDGRNMFYRLENHDIRDLLRAISR